MLHPDLSLRKRQTILEVPKNGTLKLQPQRTVSRRTSMHMRGRSVSRAEAARLEAAAAAAAAETAPPPQHDREDPEALLEQSAAAHADAIDAALESLAAQVEEIELRDQEAVRRNYETLVSISRSVAELPPQLGRLRKQVTDLSAITSALRADAQLVQEEEGPKRHSFNRASTIMLNTQWRQDLVALFRKVEGAQKFLPPIPGRHMVLDSAGWYELNAVTWTSTKPVHIFVISDNLLIAAKSSRALTVDHCWPLSDIRHQLRGKALQIQSAAGTWAYGTHNDQALEQVFASITQSKAQASGLKRQSTQLHKLPETASDSTRIIPAEEVEQARAHARDLADLDLKIAKRDWPAATEICLNSTLPGIEARLRKLEGILLGLAKNGGQPLALLASLGRADEAIEIYLSERSRLISERATDVPFKGDIVSHLSEVAVVYFEHIIATVRTYCSAFPAAQYAARVVSWTKGEIEQYAMVFNRQLYNIHPSKRVYIQCVEITRIESAQLKDLGLDMDFLLDWLVE